MSKTSDEKRNYPRIKTNLKVHVLNDIAGESVDLSEGGMGFNSSEVISSPAISLKIHFPEGNFDLKTSARLIWKRDLEEKSSLYGVEFVDLDETQRAILRKELVKTQIHALLDEIKSHEAKKQISHFFVRDLLDYISEIHTFASHLSYQKDYSLDLQKKLDHLNNHILLRGYCLEELLTDNRVMEKVKDSFRQLLGVWLYKSICMKRGLDKPRGYPGDYKMLEIVYDNKAISKGIGEYFDNYFLKSPYAVAVRIRKDHVREILQDFINKSTLNKIEILNIACGPCREIKELLPNITNKNPIVFICLDRDEEALDFSNKVFLKNTPPNVTVKFVKEDIMNMIKSQTAEQAYGKYDLIYSIGLIDYLPDGILKKLIQALYQLLRKEGRLVLTHKNSEKTFPPIPPDWACDWKFVSRDRDEVIKLFHDSGISDFSLTVESDDFEYIYYFTITRQFSNAN